MNDFKMEICLHNLEDDDEAIIPTNYIEFFVEDGNERVEYLHDDDDGRGMWEIFYTVGEDKSGWEYEGEIYDFVGVNHRGYLDVDKKSS